MSTKSGQTSGRLRVTQAFIALSSIPGSTSAPRIISIVMIGKCEIRMFGGYPTRPGEAAPLWIELFDHDVPISVDSCICHEIEDAIAAFDGMVSQAEAQKDACGREVDDARV